MKILKVISLLLDYPGEHLLDGRQELTQAIASILPMESRRSSSVLMPMMWNISTRGAGALSMEKNTMLSLTAPCMMQL